MFSIWPLLKLCRLYGVDFRTSSWLIVAFILHPALAGGCFFDFHENFLLTPCLLFFLLYAEKHCWVKATLAALCLVFIKEDAAVYLFFVSCYLFYHRDRRKEAVGFAIFSIVYFCFAIVILSRFGEGTLAVSRYSQYVSENGNMLTAGLNILKNPLHVLGASFKEDRWQYIKQIFIPLLALPLIGRKKQEIFLLVPMLLFNLMTDYSYQHTIYYQYQFGTLALLFYLTIQTIGRVEAGESWQLVVGRVKLSTFLAIIMAVLSVGVSLKFHRSQMRYWTEWKENRTVYEEMDQMLSNIQNEAETDRSVAASTKLIAHLWKVPELYDVLQADGNTDWILLDMRDPENVLRAERYQQNGYQVRDQIEGYIMWLTYAG